MGFVQISVDHYSSFVIDLNINNSEHLIILERAILYCMFKYSPNL